MFRCLASLLVVVGLARLASAEVQPGLLAGVNGTRWAREGVDDSDAHANLALGASVRVSRPSWGSTFLEWSIVYARKRTTNTSCDLGGCGSGVIWSENWAIDDLQLPFVGGWSRPLTTDIHGRVFAGLAPTLTLHTRADSPFDAEGPMPIVDFQPWDVELLIGGGTEVSLADWRVGLDLRGATELISRFHSDEYSVTTTSWSLYLFATVFYAPTSSLP